MNSASSDSTAELSATVTIPITPAITPVSTTATATETAIEATPDPNTIPNFSSYRTVEATYAALATLASEYPELATWNDIGDSYDKLTAGGADGYDIFALRLGIPPAETETGIPPAETEAVSKPVLFLQAAIHGQDYASTELATRFAENLILGYGIDPEATWLLNHVDIRIVPIVNPDGRKLAEQGKAWRKNTNPTVPAGQVVPETYGVDLDRNFDLQWGKVPTGVISPASPVYPGATAFSEPETQALRDYLTQSLKSDYAGTNLFIDLQSGSPSGGHILYPYGWQTQAPPNSQGLRRLGSKLSYWTQPVNLATQPTGLATQPVNSVTQATEPAYDVLQASSKELASGTAIDWVYQTFGTPAYTIGLGTKPFESSDRFETTIAPSGLSALIYAAKSVYSPYQATFGPDIQSLSLSSKQVIAGLTNFVTLSAIVDSTRLADGNTNPQQSAADKTIPLPQIVAGARYSIDLPSWSPDAQLYDMSIAAGDYDSTVETMVAAVDTNGLTPGRHTLFVEGLDRTGTYGVPTAIFLDVLQAPSNASVLRGTAANDQLLPFRELNFLVQAGTGDDTIQTLTGQDLILAEAGNDTAKAGSGDDVIYGGDGNDSLNGEDGNDKIYAEAGTDQLNGAAGDDLLWGGSGADLLTGGSGADTFALVFNEGADTIVDFELDQDKLALVGTLRLGQLTITQIEQSTQISLGQSVLAFLPAITASQLTASSFTSLTSTGASVVTPTVASTLTSTVTSTDTPTAGLNLSAGDAA